MKIIKDSVVAFHHKMTDEKGEVVESSAGQEPSMFLYGHKNMIETLEHSMSGKESGDKYTVTLQPEMAYGRLNLKNRMRVAKKSIGQEGKLEPGMVVPLKTVEGTRPVTIAKVGKFNVDIDFNHPLAGKTLTFDIEIVDVREATLEEIKQGKPQSSANI
ncbi:MAG: FKBP-type peptidyl-prolyl cis-trans isomerase SlyD [Saprospiraceae bacterium]|jgi:FKBP-type peptidyl-prolyl cis-trans isomerase SlyD|tara:strand:- start:140 stop:616 length:477 start_codon:yes stop_codon:yes gene_type:complete